ncbi:Serine Protease Immune Response Integrator [Carabus blaptoides fortunei]
MNYVIVVLVSILQRVYLQVNVGDDCTVTLDNSPGKCVQLAQCPSAISALQAGTYPQQCGFVGIEPIICCSTSSGLTLGISDQNCMSYSTFVPEFEVLSVVGGTLTLAREFPHMASLGYSRGDEKLWRCGGSLISDQFVLTAAHCLQSQEFGYVSWVRLGEQNLPAQSDAGFPNDYQIIERIAHPQYRAPSVYNDVALVKLDRTVRFTVFVKPACLYTNPDIAPDTTLIATGWGLTMFAGNSSEQLQKVDLDIFSEQECNETYSNMAGTRKLVSGILGDTQVCAGGRTIEKDTCQGDSGGPLQVYLNDNRLYSIVGITSFGKACGLANIPGVYSRVSYFVPWIESVVWPK